MWAVADYFLFFIEIDIKKNKRTGEGEEAISVTGHLWFLLSTFLSRRWDKLFLVRIKGPVWL